MASLNALLVHGLVNAGDSLTFKFKNHLFCTLVGFDGSMSCTKMQFGVIRNEAIDISSTNLVDFCNKCISYVDGGHDHVRISFAKRVRHVQSALTIELLYKRLQSVMALTLQY